jgi:hypothetical protein
VRAGECELVLQRERERESERERERGEGGGRCEPEVGVTYPIMDGDERSGHVNLSAFALSE